MIEWLWWSSWLLLSYACGAKNGRSLGICEGALAALKDECDILCALPHPVSGLTPCMRARMREENPLLVLGPCWVCGNGFVSGESIYWSTEPERLGAHERCAGKLMPLAKPLGPC